MNYFKKFASKPQNFFGFLFWNFLFGYFPIGLFIAILSLFGIVGFTLNDKIEYGFTGFIMHIILAPFIALIFSTVSWVFLSIGNFILKQLG
jgi:hypothetical protein